MRSRFIQNEILVLLSDKNGNTAQETADTLEVSVRTVYKYKVSVFTVRDENTRYYAISSVFRYFNSAVDEQVTGGNGITEVSYAVNKQYCFGSVNGKPYISVIDVETIVVTDKFVGFVRYRDGFKFYVGACDSHFVAFNTDKPIERLLEADVYYTTQGCASSWVALGGTNESFGDKADNYAYLKYTDKVEHSGGGLFAGTYTWDRIQTVDEFISGENREDIYHGAILDIKTSSRLTDSAMRDLQGKRWVLRFAETEYTAWNGTGSYGTLSTIVGDVTILRLKFETDGIVYNLGVVDNKQTGGNEPMNEEETEIALNKSGKSILGLFLLVALLMLLGPVLPYVAKGIIFIISLPIEIVVGVIKAVKKKVKYNENG